MCNMFGPSGEILFCGHWVCLMVTWYIFSVLVCCTKNNLATLFQRAWRRNAAAGPGASCSGRAASGRRRRRTRSGSCESRFRPKKFFRTFFPFYIYERTLKNSGLYYNVRPNCFIYVHSGTLGKAIQIQNVLLYICSTYI
jgi:hypothetical protein